MIYFFIYNNSDIISIQFLFGNKLITLKISIVFITQKIHQASPPHMKPLRRRVLSIILLSMQTPIVLYDTRCSVKH